MRPGFLLLIPVPALECARMSESPHPKYRCRRCEDWGTVVAPDGRGTLPCPEPIHLSTNTNPTAVPPAGEEDETGDRDNNEH